MHFLFHVDVIDLIYRPHGVVPVLIVLTHRQVQETVLDPHVLDVKVVDG